VAEASPSPKNIRVALEDLRTADRILMSVQGTTQFLTRQQRLDTLGMPTADGYFGDVTRSDNQHASDELLVAQQAMTDATRRLGLATPEPETLAQWGRLDDIFDNVWSDFLALEKARANHEIAGRVRTRERALFARTCELYPEATAGIEPLSDDSIEDPELRPPRDWPKLILLVLFAAVGIANIFW
jgi:hypothetical protein